MPEYMRIGYGSVYEDLRMLELTRTTLINGTPISIPDDNRRIVEAVTHPERLTSLVSTRWTLHRMKVEGASTAKAVSANLATALYDRPFGTFVFQESGGRVTTRIGADSLHLPVSNPFVSPFGQLVESVVIPGHMAPSEPAQQVEVESVEDGIASLRVGERSYRYSQFGLEAVT